MKSLNGVYYLKIGIWQGTRGLLLKTLAAAFPQGDYLLRPRECDICVSDGPLPDAVSPCVCVTAVLPGDKPVDCRFLRAERVVTYGLSGKNTVALSSVGGDSLMLALQREVMALCGTRLEEQEVLVRNAAPTAAAMAAATAMLVSGAEPSSLENAFPRAE